MPNAVPHVCACDGRPLVRTYMRFTDRTLRMAIGIPIALGRSQAAARLDQSRSRPGCNALAPRDEPLFMHLWTWSLREAARGSGVQRPAPHHSERAPPPLKPHPQSPLNHAGAAHTRPSGYAAHAERGPTCMCVRRAPSRARPCVAPPGSACSRCPYRAVGVTEPTPPRGAPPMSRSRLMPPGHRTARGGHTPERDVGPAGLPRSALQSRPMRG